MIKQTENYDAFFEKYGFTMTIIKPHPVYKDSMTFSGLEAHYVSMLEMDISKLKEQISLLELLVKQKES